MTRRTVTFAAVGIVVVVAAVVAGLMLFTGSEGSADPDEAAVTDLCRDAAAEQLGTDRELKDFTVRRVTHEVEDGITFYRELGDATRSDGYGGVMNYSFDCRAKSSPDGKRWELIDITLL